MDEVKTFQCRICLHEAASDRDLIVPCWCSGTSKYVHRECLDNWRSQDPRSDNFTRCNQCRFYYVIEAVLQNPREEKSRRFRYKLAIFTDILIMVFIIIVLLVAIVIFLGFIDKGQWIPKRLLFTKWPTLSYIIFTLIIIFVILAIFSDGWYNILDNGYIQLSGNIVILFAMIGFGAFSAVCQGYDHITGKMRFHRQRIWLRQEAEIQRVKDFKDCGDELPNQEGRFQDQAAARRAEDQVIQV